MAGAAVATAADIAGDIMVAAMLGAAAAVAVGSVAATDAWAAPATPSVALKTMRSLGETTSGWDRVGKDWLEPGCHGGLESRLGRGRPSEAVQRSPDSHQFDVATAFLNGELEEEEKVYVRMPAAFSGQTYRLRKAVYGLMQAARAWHMKLRGELLRMGFTPSDADPCLFFKGNEERRVYILVHVDDGLIVGRRTEVQAAMVAIASAFDVKDIGEASFFLLRCG